MTDSNLEALIDAVAHLLRSVEPHGGSLDSSVCQVLVGKEQVRLLTKALKSLQPEPDYLYEPIDSREKAAMYLGCPVEVMHLEGQWLPAYLAGRTLDGLPLAEFIGHSKREAWIKARVRFRRLQEGEPKSPKDEILMLGDWCRSYDLDGPVMNTQYRRVVNHDGSDFEWGSVR